MRERVRVLRYAVQPQDAAELRQWRTAAGLTQHQLAPRAGVPPRRYSRMERGKQPITPQVLAVIREALASR